MTAVRSKADAAPGDDADRSAAMARELLVHARQGNLGPIGKLMNKIIAQGEEPAPSLRRVRDVLYAAGKHYDFYRLTGKLFQTQSPSLALASAFLAASVQCDRVAIAERIVASTLRAVPEDEISWSSEDFLGRFALGEDGSRLLTGFKFGVERVARDADILALADRIAPRVRLAPALLDLLFANSRADLPRDAWEHRVRRAFALDHIVQDQFFTGVTFQDHILPRVDVAAWTEVKRVVNAAERMLCLTCHAGLLAPNRALFEQEKDWLTLQAKEGRASKSISAGADPRAALFMAFREVQDGRRVLIAPDGPWGNRTETLAVLGTQTPAGEGAAFIAYNAQATMAWLNVHREGDRLVPVLAAGPERAADEDYAAYKSRWNDFYTGEIVRLFTGEPDNIALRSRWTRPLLNKPVVPA